MNSEQLTGILRIIIPVLISLFGGAVLPDATVTSITAIAVTVLSSIWSLFVHTNASAVQIAAAIPEVKSVVMYPTVAGKALADKAGSTPDAQVTVAGK